LTVHLASEHDDAARIAAEAGRALLRLREQRDLSPTDLKAAGDQLANEVIVRALSSAYPGDPILSEERADDRARLGSARVWIVDPLDGSREFAEAGRTDWAVHVALILDGRPVAGAVALPARQLTLGTDPPPPYPEAARSRRRLVVSRSRPPDFVRELAERLDAELVEMGSAGAKAMSVVLGAADIYVHAGGQYEWDSAAPAAVATAAGLHVSRLDGSDLLYNQPSPWLPDLLICRRELASEVLRAVSTLSVKATGY
jgi:3'(2'), 5'-bisphosphate nucleotidase